MPGIFWKISMLTVPGLCRSLERLGSPLQLLLVEHLELWSRVVMAAAPHNVSLQESLALLRRSTCIGEDAARPVGTEHHHHHPPEREPITATHWILGQSRAHTSSFLLVLECGRKPTQTQQHTNSAQKVQLQSPTVADHLKSNL